MLTVCSSKYSLRSAFSTVPCRCIGSSVPWSSLRFIGCRGSCGKERGAFLYGFSDILCEFSFLEVPAFSASRVSCGKQGYPTGLALEDFRRFARLRFTCRCIGSFVPWSSLRFIGCRGSCGKERGALLYCFSDILCEFSFLEVPAFSASRVSCGKQVVLLRYCPAVPTERRGRSPRG